jgi:hypothetical protein
MATRQVTVTCVISSAFPPRRHEARNELFGFVWDFASAQLQRHGAQIDPLKPTWPKLHMNVEARIDRLADQVLEIGG